MFIETTVEHLGSIVRRQEVPRGSLYRYVDGNGFEYLCFGRIDDFYMGGKLRGHGANNINLTCTPSSSSTVARDCKILGTFQHRLHMHDTPEICTLTENHHHSFGTVISLPNDTNEEGLSHLYMMCGTAPTGPVGAAPVEPDRHLLLRLTKANSDTTNSNYAFHSVSHNGIVAIRGKAFVSLERHEPN